MKEMKIILFGCLNRHLKKSISLLPVVRLDYNGTKGQVVVVVVNSWITFTFKSPELGLDDLSFL